MNEPAAQDAAPGKTAGLLIHKVLSRGAGDEAQVLLVLVSALLPTAADVDVWVGIGITEPETIFARTRGDSFEVARSITYNELKALDLDVRERELPFGLKDEPGRDYLLARFDFSDHPYAWGCWRKAVQAQSQSPAPSLDVTCWRARPGRMADENQVLHDSFEPLPDPRHVGVAVADVVQQPLFELGVLFVHGIGSHGERETLVHWSEPIVKLWRKRAMAINDDSRRRIDLDRGPIKRWLETHALRNRSPINGISEVVTNFAPAAPRDADGKYVAQPMVRPVSTDPTACCVSAKPEQTLFPDRNPGAPSATLFRLSSADASASLRESHVLFAESAWAREAFPPTNDELYAWLTKSIPIAVWARLERLATTRPAEIRKASQQAARPAERLMVRLSWVLLGLQQAVLPAAYVMLALASQVAIALVGVLGLLPIPWLSRGIRWVVSGLMGTLGQSYALQASPVRRSAIVSSVAIDIDWLSERCQHLVIVSHSQGAEISRLAFLEARRDKVRRWYTAGSGIAPLNMLSSKSLDQPASRNVVGASKLLLLATLLLVGTLLVDSIPGVNLGLRAGVMRWVQGASLGGLAGAYAALSVFLILLSGVAGPDVSPQLRRSLMEQWTDYFASEDPVPGGSLLDRWGFDLKREGIEGCEQRRIFNTRFALMDHTTYFKNIEQFVAPIALDLLGYCGMRGNAASERLALDDAARRREWRTWWTLAASVLAIGAAAVTFAWIAFGPPARAAAWFVEGRSAWDQGKDAFERLFFAWNHGSVGMVVRDLWLPLLLVGTVIPVWRVSRYLGIRSVKTLIEDLARSASSHPSSGSDAP